MQPKTLSASSLNNWEECPAKFGASNIDYTPELGKKEPAKVGTCVHEALQFGVQRVYIDKDMTWADALKYMIEVYNAAFAREFGTADRTSEWYKDGLSLIKVWYKRTNLEGKEILAVEEKKRLADIFPGGILLTYIFDRVERWIDEDGRKILKVIDYKTERSNYTHDALIKKLQVRIYGMCAAVEFKDWQPDEIWVELDMLRFEPISVMITYEDNLETLQYLRDTGQNILDAVREELPRFVGAGCRYCPISFSCEPLIASAEAGSVMSINDINEIVAKREFFAGSIKAMEILVTQLDSAIHAYAEDQGRTKFVAGGHPVTITAPSRRGVDASLAAKIIGPEIMAQVASLTIGEVDKLMKPDSPLTDEQREKLKKLIGKKYGNPGLKIEPVPPIKEIKS